MRIKETKVYLYDELTSDARQKARNWYEAGVFDYDWWEHIYEDAASIGIKIKSFDDHEIDGEIITSAPEVIETIRANHGETCETYKTATHYLPIFQALENMRDVDDKDFEDAFEKAEKELLRDILEDYRIMLRKEAEYMTSVEYLEDGIRANEYEFDEYGRRA